MKKLPEAFSNELYIRIYKWFGLRPQIQSLHVRNLLNSHDEVSSRGDLDSVEEDVEVVDLSIDEAIIEDLDATLNIDHVKRVIDVRDSPTDGEPFHGSGQYLFIWGPIKGPIL